MGHIVEFSWVISLLSACGCMANLHVCSMAHIVKLSAALDPRFLCRSVMSTEAGPVSEQQKVSTLASLRALVLELPTFNLRESHSAASMPGPAHSATVKSTRQRAQSVARAAAREIYPQLRGLQLATVSICSPLAPPQLAQSSIHHVGRASAAELGPCRRLGRSVCAVSPRAGVTCGIPGPGDESGAVATPTLPHPCTLLHIVALPR